MTTITTTLRKRLNYSSQLNHFVSADAASEHTFSPNHHPTNNTTITTTSGACSTILTNALDLRNPSSQSFEFHSIPFEKSALTESHFQAPQQHRSERKFMSPDYDSHDVQQAHTTSIASSAWKSQFHSSNDDDHQEEEEEYEKEADQESDTSDLEERLNSLERFCVGFELEAKLEDHFHEAFEQMKNTIDKEAEASSLWLESVQSNVNIIKNRLGVVMKKVDVLSRNVEKYLERHSNSSSLLPEEGFRSLEEKEEGVNSCQHDDSVGVIIDN
nr:unnamed protein product [Naegleria fowleri]